MVLLVHAIYLVIYYIIIYLNYGEMALYQSTLSIYLVIYYIFVYLDIKIMGKTVLLVHAVYISSYLLHICLSMQTSKLFENGLTSPCYLSSYLLHIYLSKLWGNRLICTSQHYLFIQLSTTYLSIQISKLWIMALQVHAVYISSYLLHIYLQQVAEILLSQLADGS